MKFTKNDIDALNSIVTITIEEADYQERVDKQLRDYRKKAAIPGFRVGMAPMGHIKKAYGKPVLVDEINKILSESLFAYIREENLNILGEPLPAPSDKPVDFDADKEFSFSFELGLAPTLDLEINNEIALDFYQIKATDEEISKQIDFYRERMADSEEVDTVSEKSVLKADLTENTENGHNVESAMISVEFVKDEDVKNMFIGNTVGAQISFNPMAALGNEAEVANLLKVTKEDTEKLNADYTATIVSITNYKRAELTQEFFDKLYGAGAVNSVEEMQDKVRGELEHNYFHDSEYKFELDAKKYFTDKHPFDLPVSFLKRWILESNRSNKDSKLSPETIDSEFPQFENSLKWQIISNKIISQLDLKVEQHEIENEAMHEMYHYFSQYGFNSGLESYVQKFAIDKLQKDENYARQVAEKVMENKLFKKMREIVTLNTIETTPEEFKAMMS